MYIVTYIICLFVCVCVISLLLLKMIERASNYKNVKKIL